MKAYRAKYVSGRVIPHGGPVIPEGSELIVTILDEPARDDETVRRLAALDKFFSDIETSDEEVPEFERVKLREIEI